MCSSNLAVVMSVYKNDDPVHFSRAICSILSQEYPLELINIYLAVDGDIPNDLESVIQLYKDHFKIILRSSNNRGLALSLNALIDSLGNEEYVFRMDSDDVSHSDRFITQIDFLKKNRDIDICGGSINEMFSNGTQVRTYLETHEELVAAIGKASPFAHPTVCFRRAAIDLLGGYSNKYYLCEDVELWFRAVGLGLRFGNVQQVLLDFRINERFFKRRSKAKMFSEFKAYMAGIYSIKGIDYSMIYVLARLAFRLAPRWFSEFMYKSDIRKYITK